jgi:hypothetical protein
MTMSAELRVSVDRLARLLVTAADDDVMVLVAERREMRCGLAAIRVVLAGHVVDINEGPTRRPVEEGERHSGERPRRRIGLRGAVDARVRRCR